MSLPQDDPFKASVNIGLSERFSLAYTCCKCDTRNLVSVSRVAWTTGLVIGKCRGCDAKHMLADNGGLTDETNSSRFSNVVNAAIAKGEAVGRLGLDDALALAEAGVEVLPGGNVSLVPRGAEEAVFDESGAVLPDRSAVYVELLPEDANPGMALNVAFPVVVLDAAA
ncbi:zinc ion binding protein [Aureococcus anophagefferens]|nr:zinc ion binding protein [Aureococcus anophagefferens]